METTLSETQEPNRQDSWFVFVAFCTKSNGIGQARRLLPGAQCELAREAATFGEGVLDDTRISRKHAVLEVDPVGTLYVRDEGSSNGTYVNGERVERALLRSGSLVRVGSVLLLVKRAKEVASTAGPFPFCGPSEQSWQVKTALEQAIAKRTPLLFVGEAGTGAQELSRYAQQIIGGSWKELSLEGWSEKLPDPWIDAVRSEQNGVLFSSGIPIAGSTAEGIFREVLAARNHKGPFVCCALSLTVEGLTSQSAIAAQAKQLGLQVLELPPLRERAEDLASIALSVVQSKGSTWPLLGHRDWYTLLTTPWKDNLPQFLSVLAAVERAQQRNETVALEELLSKAIGAVESASPVLSSRLDPALLVRVEREGRWVQLPGQGRVSLHRRPVLARLLAALASARVERPGSVLRGDLLIEQVWPGEKLVNSSGENRLHVALTHLRQLGFRTMLERIEDGYRISPSVQIELADEE